MVGVCATFSITRWQPHTLPALLAAQTTKSWVAGSSLRQGKKKKQTTRH